jgi:hypothetical protein
VAEHITRDSTGRAIDKSIFMDGRKTAPVGGLEILAGEVDGLEVLCLEASADGAATFTILTKTGAIWPGGTLTLGAPGTSVIVVPVASPGFRVSFAAAVGTQIGACFAYLRRGSAT